MPKRALFLLPTLFFGQVWSFGWNVTARNYCGNPIYYQWNNLGPDNTNVLQLMESKSIILYSGEDTFYSTLRFSPNLDLAFPLTLSVTFDKGSYYAFDTSEMNPYRSFDFSGHGILENMATCAELNSSSVIAGEQNTPAVYCRNATSIEVQLCTA